MARDMEKQIKELKKQNSYLLDRLDKAYNDKMLLRQQNIKSQSTVETVKEAIIQDGKVSR
jgi:hypothetical protein|tara:strand:+ start:177 stop:356 length:180 start_codon:yes stop_codon:yes gene_type:complete